MYVLHRRKVEFLEDNSHSCKPVWRFVLQCRIIESVLTHCDWFFGGHDLDGHDVLMLDDAFHVAITQTGDAGLLLHNLQKLEESGKMVILLSD